MELDKEIFPQRKSWPPTPSCDRLLSNPSQTVLWAVTKGRTVIALVNDSAATLHQLFSHPLILLTAELISLEPRLDTLRISVQIDEHADPEAEEREHRPRHAWSAG